MKRRGWRSGQLTKRRKEDVQKLGIARRLGEETTMTQGWIAGKLKRGSAGYAAHCLRKKKCSQYAQMRDPFTGLNQFQWTDDVRG